MSIQSCWQSNLFSQGYLNELMAVIACMTTMISTTPAKKLNGESITCQQLELNLDDSAAFIAQQPASKPEKQHSKQTHSKLLQLLLKLIQAPSHPIPSQYVQAAPPKRHHPRPYKNWKTPRRTSG